MILVLFRIKHIYVVRIYYLCLRQYIVMTVARLLDEVWYLSDWMKCASRLVTKVGSPNWAGCQDQ